VLSTFLGEQLSSIRPNETRTAKIRGTDRRTGEIRIQCSKAGKIGIIGVNGRDFRSLVTKAALYWHDEFYPTQKAMLDELHQKTSFKEYLHVQKNTERASPKRMIELVETAIKDSITEFNNKYFDKKPPSLKTVLLGNKQKREERRAFSAKLDKLLANMTKKTPVEVLKLALAE
jgi:hypothetical protein